MLMAAIVAAAGRRSKRHRGPMLGNANSEHGKRNKGALPGRGSAAKYAGVGRNGLGRALAWGASAGREFAPTLHPRRPGTTDSESNPHAAIRP
jgi:hypothetical protein